MKLSKSLIESRPDGIKPTTKFTDGVMMRIQKSNRKNKLWRVISLRPASSLLLALIVVGLISGASYAAVKLLWPEPSVKTIESSKSSTDRQQMSIYSSSCGTEELKRNFEVKRGENISQSDMEATIKADCEYRAASKWAVDHFGQSDFMPSPEPGLEYTFEQTSLRMPEEIKSIQDRTITLGQSNQSFEIPDQAIIVADRQQADFASLKVGDVISVATHRKAKYRNQDSCNNMHCSSEVLNDNQSVVSMVKFNFTMNDFERLNRLMQLSPCLGNDSEACLGVGAVEVFTRKFEANTYFPQDAKFAIVEGAIKTISSEVLAIKTSSDRLVTIKTPYDIAAKFNADQLNLDKNIKMTEGDRLSIMYRIAGDQTRELQFSDISHINLLMEISNRTDPLIKY